MDDLCISTIFNDSFVAILWSTSGVFVYNRNEKEKYTFNRQKVAQVQVWRLLQRFPNKSKRSICQNTHHLQRRDCTFYHQQPTPARHPKISATAETTEEKRNLGYVFVFFFFNLIQFIYIPFFPWLANTQTSENKHMGGRVTERTDRM